VHRDDAALVEDNVLADVDIDADLRIEFDNVFVETDMAASDDVNAILEVLLDGIFPERNFFHREWARFDVDAMTAVLIDRVGRNCDVVASRDVDAVLVVDVAEVVLDLDLHALVDADAVAVIAADRIAAVDRHAQTVVLNLHPVAVVIPNHIAANLVPQRAILCATVVNQHSCVAVFEDLVAWEQARRVRRPAHDRGPCIMKINTCAIQTIKSVISRDQVTDQRGLLGALDSHPNQVIARYDVGVVPIPTNGGFLSVEKDNPRVVA
jgi:hypothetical protein